MAVIIILIAVAIPRYEKSITRAKESVLHNNLSPPYEAQSMSIPYDKQKAPPQLQDLVTEGYLRGKCRETRSRARTSGKRSRRTPARV